jgi:methylamine dehydrogenase accessory protein MauD
MEGFWLISYVTLWCLTMVLALVVLAHSRLLGLLHYRFGPAGARPLADGPDLGRRLGRLEAGYLNGSRWTKDFPTFVHILLIFVSPQCQTCNELIPHVKDFVRARRDAEVILMSTIEDLGMNRAYVAYRGLDRLTYLIGAKLADDFNIEGTPYALLISREGVVIGKGVVNNYENLERLTKESVL